MTVINWAEVLENAKSASFAIIPKGEYHVKLEEVKATTASTGKPMLKFRCRVQTGPNARGSILTQQVLTLDNPNALNIFIKFLGAFGVGTDYLAQLGTTADLTPIAQALEGREGIAVVEIEPWQGEDRNQVKRFKPLSGGLTGGVPAGMPGMPVAPPMGGPQIPTPGSMPPPPIPTPSMPSVVGIAPPPPAPVMPTAPPAPPMPSAAPQMPPQPPIAPAAPVGPPAPAQAPQAAPQPAPQTSAPAAPAAPAPAFDFASLPPELQQQIMAQMMQQAAPEVAAPPAPQSDTPAAPAVVAPPLPY